jgi:hypothetical protein
MIYLYDLSRMVVYFIVIEVGDRHLPPYPLDLITTSDFVFSYKFSLFILFKL